MVFVACPAEGRAFRVPRMLEVILMHRWSGNINLEVARHPGSLRTKEFEVRALQL